MPRIIDLSMGIPDDFYWFNPPQYQMNKDGLQLKTDPKTDFWQRTHYGFQPDNGHCLLTKVTGNISFTTCVSFQPQKQYDQCGLILRLDSQNWVKMSAEYETEQTARLGSVVTNHGFSDWATTDIPATIRRICYRFQTHGQDFLLENSFDGQKWQQMRIGHLHHPFDTFEAGIYACSPLAGDGFYCTFAEIMIGESNWS